jgi:hypothetical protein
MYSMKAHKGSGGRALPKLAAVNLMPRPYYSQRKNSWHLFNRRPVGQSRFGPFGEEENILSLPGIEPLTVRPADKSLHHVRSSGSSTPLN